MFHRIPILGCVEIIPTEEKRTLFGALAKGMRDGADGGAADCFEPRHGIRIINGTSTNDLVVCFECFQIEAYGSNFPPDLLTTGSPNATFNNLLDKYHLAKAR